MSFSFTPQAARKIQAIMAEKRGRLALRIRIRRTPGGGQEWEMKLEEQQPDALVVNGVPVQADPAVLKRLEGLIIDWVLTPDGPGLGVYDRNLLDQPD